MIRSNRGMDAPVIILVLLGIIFLAVGVIGIMQVQKIGTGKGGFLTSVPVMPLKAIGALIGQSALIVGGIVVVLAIILFAIAYHMM
ncbi:MAG: hypothetical protein ABH829_01420 [archaeon]